MCIRDRVYTHDPRLMEKLELLAKKHPDQITRKDAHNFTVPKRCVSVREPYSAERRKAASERAKAAGYQPPVRTVSYTHLDVYKRQGKYPAFKGLLEIMSAETTIVTAIHNIKSNHGSDTPGVDNKTMRREYLQKPYRWVINDIQRAVSYTHLADTGNYQIMIKRILLMWKPI